MPFADMFRRFFDEMRRQQPAPQKPTDGWQMGPMVPHPAPLKPTPQSGGWPMGPMVPIPAPQMPQKPVSQGGWQMGPMIPHPAPQQPLGIPRPSSKLARRPEVYQGMMSGYRKGGKVKRKDIGRPIVVGEEGPEVIVPLGPAAVVPNEALRVLAPPAPPVAEPEYIPPALLPAPADPLAAATVAPLGRPPRLTSPEMGATGDRLSDLREYHAELGAYEPRNNNSRLKSILIGLGRGALQGLGSGGGLGGALGGALTGGIIHGVDPSSDERFHRLGEMERTQGQIGQELGIRKLGSDLQSAEVERQAKMARTMKDLMPEGPDYERVETPEGYVYVDKNNPTAPPLKTGLMGKPSAEKMPQREWIKGVLHVIGSDGVPTPVKNVDGSLVTDETRVPTEVNIGGQRFTLPPTAAANALATQGREARQQEREEKGDERWEYGEQQRQAERSQGEESQTWRDAETRVNRYNEMRRALDKLEARKQALLKVPEADRGKLVDELNAIFPEQRSLVQAMDALRDELDSAYGDFITRPNQSTFGLKPRPRRPAPAPPPRRSGSAPRRSGNYVPPRVSRSELESLLR